MVPFLFTSLGRFSEPGAGAFYAADTLDTALAKVLHHRRRAFEFSGASRATARFRHLHSDHSLDVADARGQRTTRPHLYTTDAGGDDDTRAFAMVLRTRGDRGIIIGLAADSLRDGPWTHSRPTVVAAGSERE